MKKGWVYARRSSNCPHIKIGLTTTSPFQRLVELNRSPNYGPLGPWSQLDIRQVKDTSGIEKALHRRFDVHRVRDMPGVSALFRITPAEARAGFEAIPQIDLSADVPINNLRLAPDFADYLTDLFRHSGLRHFRDLQESWTFSLFPSTAGGRYFTLNIDKHEVAYSAP